MIKEGPDHDAAVDPVSRFGFLVVGLILLIWSLWALPHELHSSARPYRQVLFSLWMICLYFTSPSSCRLARGPRKVAQVLVFAGLILVIAYAYAPLFG